jgi:gamma-glutamyltranspeptidase / glutathione hydrolase
MKLALADTYRWVADADHMRDVTPPTCSTTATWPSARGSIDPRRAGDPGHGTPGAAARST